MVHHESAHTCQYPERDTYCMALFLRQSAAPPPPPIVLRFPKDDSNKTGEQGPTDGGTVMRLVVGCLVTNDPKKSSAGSFEVSARVTWRSSFAFDTRVGALHLVPKIGLLHHQRSEKTPRGSRITSEQRLASRVVYLRSILSRGYCFPHEERGWFAWMRARGAHLKTVL